MVVIRGVVALGSPHVGHSLSALGLGMGWWGWNQGEKS